MAKRSATKSLNGLVNSAACDARPHEVAVKKPVRKAPRCPACGNAMEGVTESAPSLLAGDGQLVYLLRCGHCLADGLTVQGRAAATAQGAVDNWVSSYRLLERRLRCDPEPEARIANAPRPITRRRVERTYINGGGPAKKRAAGKASK